jgi:cyclohexa-1,5-dienecarbonyl-CoA hydratase
MTAAPAVQPIGRIVLDHPPLNILTRGGLHELRVELARLAEERGLRVLVLTAAGKHFCAGADVAEHLPPHHAALIPEFLETVAALAEFPVPVVVGVQGRCLGGGFELVQAADLIVAGESAVFGQPEIALGVVPPAACVLLPEWLPRGLAARLIYSGAPISAREAERAGLVAQVVPDAAVEAATLELAATIARHSAAALRIAKQTLSEERAWARRAALQRAGRIYLTDVMATADALEGLRAFVDKRPAVWSDA